MNYTEQLSRESMTIPRQEEESPGKRMLQHATVRVGTVDLHLSLLGCRLVAGGSQQYRQSEPARTGAQLTAEEAVARKNYLIRNWQALTSDEILCVVQNIQSAGLLDVPESDLSEEMELWLLRALALEKALKIDAAHIEAVYHECRRGRFHTILVRNNLAAIHVERQWCRQALDSLAAAIRASLAYRVHLRAPFYNCALILEFLHTSRLIFHTSHLEVLGTLQQLVSAIQHGYSQEQILNLEPAVHVGPWSDEEIRAVYVELARHAYETNDTSAVAVTANDANFVLPELDFFASFGDVPDEYLRQQGHEMLDQGTKLSSEKQFERALGAFDLVPHYNPDLKVEAGEKKRQACDQWRNEFMSALTGQVARGDFEGARKTLSGLPARLARTEDGDIARNLRSQEMLAAARKADELSRDGEKEGARRTCLWLLAQTDIDPELRRRVSVLLETLLP